MPKYATFLKLICAFATIFAILWWLEADGEKLLDLWKTVNNFHLSFALLLLPLNLGVQAWIWQVLLQEIYPDERFIDSLGGILCGASLGFFTPARIGDFAGRALYMPHRNKIELLALASLQQSLSFLCYIGFGTLALGYFLPFKLKFAWFGWILVALLGVLFLGIAFYALLNPQKIYRLILNKLPLKWQTHFRFLNYLSRAHLLKLVALTILRYGIFCTQFVLLLYAFPFELRLLDAIIATMLIYYIKTFIPSFAFAELGIREATAVFLIGWMGGSELVAFNAATLIFGINLVLPALLGIPFIFKIKVKTEK